MEERNLRWVHTGGSWGDNNFNIRDSSGFGNSLSSMSHNGGFKIEGRSVRENETEFLDQVRDDNFEFFIGFTETAEKIVVFHVFVEGVSSHIKGFLNNGVLTNN